MPTIKELLDTQTIRNFIPPISPIQQTIRTFIPPFSPIRSINGYLNTENVNNLILELVQNKM